MYGKQVMRALAQPAAVWRHRGAAHLIPHPQFTIPRLFTPLSFPADPPSPPAHQTSSPPAADSPGPHRPGRTTPLDFTSDFFHFPSSRGVPIAFLTPESLGCIVGQEASHLVVGRESASRSAG